MRYILADELHCFPPEPVEEKLTAIGLTYVQLLERIAVILAQKPALFFQEIARHLPSYWAVFVQDNYPETVKTKLLESLHGPNEQGLDLWEGLAPYVLKKGTTLAIESLVYEREEWVMSLLDNWSKVESQLDVSALEQPLGPKRPLLGMVLEGEHILNKVQILAISAAQKEGASRGENIPFGAMAVKLGMLKEQQLEDVLQIQKDIAVALDSPKRLGFYLLEAGVVTPTQVRDSLMVQRETGMPLGAVLVQTGAIDQSLLDTMLHIQRLERITTFTQDLAV
ncbi:MAG: exopolysaccharide biosynthesis protein WecB/TagA/CpsF family [Cyanobacteria bacterium RYN_339]|nr:exopolysaccharide biosynthesis protein WecB/TagA/CpsF family [Cyanobacteria bacterium RYN_339]